MRTINLDSDLLFIDMHFSFFSQCVSRIEYGLEQQAKEAEAQLNGLSDDLDPDTRYYSEMQYQNELELAAGYVPPLAFATMLATVWSSFEHGLTIVTQRHLRKTLPADLTAEERTKKLNKIRDLVEIKKHWEKNKATFPSGWDEVLDIREVRNLVVHDNSWRHEMSPDETDVNELTRHTRVKTVTSYIERRERQGRSGLSFQDDQMIVTSDYCREVEKALCGYVRALVPALTRVEPDIYQHIIDVLYPKAKTRDSGRKRGESGA
jgi:hypothetical protein